MRWRIWPSKCCLEFESFSKATFLQVKPLYFLVKHGPLDASPVNNWDSESDIDADNFMALWCFIRKENTYPCSVCGCDTLEAAPRACKTHGMCRTLSRLRVHLVRICTRPWWRHSIPDLWLDDPLLGLPFPVPQQHSHQSVSSQTVMKSTFTTAHMLQTSLVICNVCNESWVEEWAWNRSSRPAKCTACLMLELFTVLNAFYHI